MEDDWQGVGRHVSTGGESRVPKEVEDEGIERLEGCNTELESTIIDTSGAGLTQCVTLLDKSLKEEIRGADTVELLSSLGRRDLAQALNGHTGVDGRNGHTGQNTSDDLSLTQGARSGSGQGEQEACQRLAGLFFLSIMPNTR